MASISASRRFLVVGPAKGKLALPEGNQRPTRGHVQLIIAMEQIEKTYEPEHTAELVEAPRACTRLVKVIRSTSTAGPGRQDLIVAGRLRWPFADPAALKSSIVRRLLMNSAVRAQVMFGPRVKAKPMNSVQIADALLKLEGAASLAGFFSSGRRCDAVPVQCVMLKMFPDASYEDLAAGLELAVTVARLDVAEAEALDGAPARTTETRR